MNRKLLPVILIILGALLLWLLGRREGPGAAAPGKINLSYDICLKAEAGFQVLEHDSLSRINYALKYWVDSTGQYFSKSLLSPSGDTLFVSVFNNASMRRAEEALRMAGFEHSLHEQGKARGFAFHKALARSADGALFLRYLIADPRFQSVVMADQPGRDSMALVQKFRNAQLIQSIEKCL